MSAIIMIPITAHIIARLKRELGGYNPGIDYHLAVPNEAENVVQPIFFLFIFQTVTSTIISLSHSIDQDGLTVNVTITTINSALNLASIYAIAAAAKILAGLESDDWLDDPEDTLMDYVRGYLEKGKGIRRAALPQFLAALAHMVLIAVGITYLNSLAVGSQLTITQAASATFGRQLPMACTRDAICPTKWHFGAAFFLANIVCIPVFATIVIALALSALRPTSRYFRYLTKGAWALAQPYPLIARLFGLLAAGLTILRLYGHSHWGW
jgi:hypothetical protein